MIHTPIVPNRHVVWIRPPMPHLQVVILHNHLHEPVQQVPALGGTEAVDALAVLADGEDGFPARDRVRADDRVLGTEVGADVFGRAAGPGEEGEVVSGGGFAEARLGVGCREGVEEFLVGW